ncbi:hypothetical protein ABLE68_15295 [Nocardioides sp. CN2-186]|uniref:hypothetical protein n=1 Tax=Nocardioides tweenelious TaxID=3156607 RepID=UPI0032B331B5
MSKMDALRAMREARYAEAQASKPKAATGKPTMPAKAPVAPAAKTTAGADDGLCGHRSMNGRTCTREHGHAAKNHRYS